MGLARVQPLLPNLSTFLLLLARLLRIFAHVFFEIDSERLESFVFVLG